jgi:putative NADH-flavin reductase
MKVAVIGNGYTGEAIIAEALARGHDVTVLARSPEKVAPRARLTVIRTDIHDVAAAAQALRGHDSLINAWSPGRGVVAVDIFEQFVAGYRAIIAAAKQAGVKRFLTVGGAASLKTRAGIEFLDSDEFPAIFEPNRDGIRGTREQYYLLKREPGLDWVFLAPSVMLLPGERTGKYRVGTDHVLYDSDGVSRISLPDYAKAMIDELEEPQHHRERFTVGY